MKKISLLTITALLALGSAAFAAGTTATPGVFTVEANLPAATDVQFVTSKVVGSTFSDTVKGSGAALTWGTSDLQFYDKENGVDVNVWRGKHYYAIDFNPVSGTQSAPGNYQNVTFAYSSESNPTGQAAGTGLGEKGTITLVKTILNSTTGKTEDTKIIAKALKDVGTISGIDQTKVNGGWFRVYLGLYPGAASGSADEVANAKPFTNADQPGKYTGKLTISVTLN